MFDPAADATTGGDIRVPAGVGNSVSPNNVLINDTQTEFATLFGSGSSRASVDVNTAGLITYAVQFGSASSNYRLQNPVITLASDAFSGCSLTAVNSTFPPQGTDPPSGQQVYNNTVTGSLVGNVLRLTAAWLSCRQNYPNDKLFLTASWKLEGCPVRLVGCWRSRSKPTLAWTQHNHWVDR